MTDFPELETKMTRRQFLGRSVKAGLGVAAALVVGTSGDSEREESIASRIRDFENKKSDEFLSFEEARSVLPLITELYQGKYSSIKSTKDILSSIYILRDSGENVTPSRANTVVFPDGARMTGSSMASNFLQDYPNSDVPGSEIVLFIASTNASYALTAATNKGKIFLYLNRLNDPNVDLRQESKRPILQYKGFGEEAVESSYKPTVNLRSTLLHELVHYDTEFDGDIALDPELLASFQRVSIRHVEQGQISAGKQIGFSVSLRVYKDEAKSYLVTGVEELAADYLMFKAYAANLLSYSAGHGTSNVDAGNLEKILRQSGVSDEKFHKMHQKAQLKELLLAIAKGAKNIEFKSNEEMLDFGIESLFFNTANNEKWSYLEPYFDGLIVEPKKETRKIRDESCITLPKI